jgi:uncharacterized membrane protein YqaE (UPF0057 family)
MLRYVTNHTISTDASRARRVTSNLIPVAVFACAFLFLIITMDRLVSPYDEGLILVGSTRVLTGDIPYRDFYANYGPAQFYVLATLFKVFGPSVLVERLWDLLARSCVVLVIYLIVDRTWSRGRAIFLAALTGLWLSYFENYGYPVFPCLLFSLLSLYCVLPVYRGSRAIVPLLASGLCVSITILFRHDVGIATAVGGAFTLGLFYMTQQLDAPSKISSLLRSAMIYTGGITIALVPPLALLLAAGAAHDMLLDLVLIPARTYVATRSLPFPSVVAIAHDVTHLKLGSLDQLAVYLPIVAVFLGAMAATTFGRNQRSPTSVDEQALTSQRLWILVQLSVFSLLFFFKGWVRVSLIHMALSIVPSLVIMTVWQVELRSRAAKILFGVGIACLLFVSLPPMQNARARFADNLAWAAADGGAPSNSLFALAQSEHGVFALAWSENGSCFPPKGLERIRCFYISREEPAAVRYIQEHTAEDEAIFVGLNRHDKILANNVLFYFVSERPPVTKWHHFDPGVQTTMEIQAEMVGEFQTRRPRYVVLDSEWDNVDEPNESAHSSGVTVLDQFIRAHYRVVAAFGALTILESRW